MYTEVHQCSPHWSCDQNSRLSVSCPLLVSGSHVKFLTEILRSEDTSWWDLKFKMQTYCDLVSFLLQDDRNHMHIYTKLSQFFLKAVSSQYYHDFLLMKLFTKCLSPDGISQQETSSCSRSIMPAGGQCLLNEYVGQGFSREQLGTK